MSYQEAGNALLDKYGNQAEKKRKKEQKGETKQGKSRSFKEDRLDFTPASSSEKIKAETKERISNAEYRRYKEKEKPVYDTGKYTKQGITASYAEVLAKADYEKDMRAYEKGVQNRWQDTVIAEKEADRQRHISSIQNRTYQDPLPGVSIEALSAIRKTAKNSGESLLYTQLYNEKVLAHYADIFANTRMDGRKHSVLDEIKLLAIMDSGREKKARKEAVLKKMEELGMKDGLNELFYPHFAGDGSFDWKTFGKWLRWSAESGAAGLFKSVADTADVTLGNILKGFGWEDNPVSKLAEYEDNNYASWKYGSNLYAEKLGGGGWNFGGEAVEATVGALPQAILAIMTHGTSLAASKGSLATKAAYETGGVLSKAGITTETMMKNPQFWISFSRTLGSDYKQAKEMGVSDELASVGSVVTSLLNAGIEIGLDGMSGIQGLPAQIDDAGTLEKVIRWLESSVQEGEEEGAQKFVNEMVAKYLYGSQEPILVPEDYLWEMGIGLASGAALGAGQVGTQMVADAISGKNMGSGWRRAGGYASQEDLSIMESLQRANLTGSMALAQTDSAGYAQRFQSAVEKGASPDQAFKRATADTAMEVIGVPLDKLLDSVAGDPKKAGAEIDAALKQWGIQMTPEERSWLSAVAAEASMLQQNADFSKRIALEMLKGLPYEQAQTAASKAVWQEAADRVIASGVSDFTFRLDERADQRNQLVVWDEQNPQQDVGDVDRLSDGAYNKVSQLSLEESTQSNENNAASDRENFVAASPVFMHSDDDMFERSKKVAPIPGYEDIAVHGDPIGFTFIDGEKNESNVSAYEFAEMVKESGLWHGGDIRLISCSTAADGAVAAQGVANYLGVNVLAPSDDVYMDFDGNMRIGKDNDGEWRLLKPKSRKEEKP